MADHPLRKRFPAMSDKGLEIMVNKLKRTGFPQPHRAFWFYTGIINAIARKGST